MEKVVLQPTDIREREERKYSKDIRNEKGDNLKPNYYTRA